MFPRTATKDRFVPQQAAVSMRVNSEFVSNKIDEKALQHEKHDEQRIWTWRGIVIELREEQQNAVVSMRVNSESVSNKIDESDVQFEMHDEERI
jgi:hypothetical protein